MNNSTPGGIRGARAWIWRGIAAAAGAVALMLGLAAAPALASSGGYTLVNAPASSVCQHHYINVGVWAQGGTSRADRRYFVDVWGPTGDHSFHSQGYAPESPQGWRIWSVKAWKTGVYRTVYGTWHNGTEYKTRFYTTSRTC